MRDKAISRGAPPHKTLVHYIGIDLASFTPDPSVARSDTVLFVGRLIENKGCEQLLRAMQLVQLAQPKSRLVIIGDGPQRARLEQLARELALRQVSFLSTQPSGLVRHWMNQARVLSVPSVTVDSGASEGFGMVFVEAQAMGLPVASFATGGIPEAVVHGETGLLARERDVAGLAHNITALLSVEPMWAQFSEAGRKRARDLFDIRRQTAALEGLYRTVLRREAMSRIGGVRAASTMNPQVSAVIPTRHRPGSLLRAVESALAQTHSPAEVVVVIDGPDPATESMLSTMTDERLRVLALPAAVGGSEARNVGVRAASGEWIAFLDDDDEWMPHKLERQLAMLPQASAEPILSCRFLARTDAGDRIWPERLPQPSEPLCEYLLTRPGLQRQRRIRGHTHHPGAPFPALPGAVSPRAEKASGLGLGAARHARGRARAHLSGGAGTVRDARARECQPPSRLARFAGMDP